MENIEKYRPSLEKARDLFAQGDFVGTIFRCDKVKLDIIKQYLDESIINNQRETFIINEFKKKYGSNSMLVHILDDISNITRKYDYDHPNVFDKEDAKKVFNSTLEFMKIMNEV